MSHPLRDTIPAARCASCGHFGMVGEITACKRPGCECKHHVGEGPYRGHDPATPPGTEAALQSLIEALDSARTELEDAVNTETDAELDRDAAHRKWMLSAPPVRRNELTVAERDAWVEEHIATEERTFRLAKAARQAAQKKLDILRSQLSAMQSISRSVGQAYQGQREPGW